MDRERSYGNDFSTTGAAIPEYDATKDKYCPLTHTRKFRQKAQQLKRLQQQEKFSSSAPARSQSATYRGAGAADRRPRRLDPVPAGAGSRLGSPATPARRDQSRRGRDDMPSLEPPRSAFTLSTMSGGITYGAPPPRTEPELPGSAGLRPLGSASTSRLGSADGGASRSAPGSREGGASSREEISAWQAEQSLSPEQELEVLKAILLREGYLKRLEKVINDWLSSGNTKSAPSGLSDLWDLIRMSTVEVVETVDTWRLAVAGEGGEDGAKPPFLWNARPRRVVSFSRAARVLRDDSISRRRA